MPHRCFSQTARRISVSHVPVQIFTHFSPVLLFDFGFSISHFTGSAEVPRASLSKGILHSCFPQEMELKERCGCL